MLAVFESGDEVLVCEVDAKGEPITADYFGTTDADRKAEDYDCQLVEAPVAITSGSLVVTVKRRLT